MVQKTERFEMRLDMGLLDQIDDWRAQQGDIPSRGEAVRRLIETSLNTKSSGQLQLSQAERLNTWMLSEILLSQKNYEDKESIKLIQDAIYGGHFWALNWELTGVLHNHSDRKEAVTLVVDTLDMWSFIEESCETLDSSDKQKIEAEIGSRGKNPVFFGFDGNNEGEYMGIANFLVNKMGRFERFKGRSLNSHTPVVERFSKMTAIFEKMRVSLVGRRLSATELIELLKFS